MGRLLTLEETMNCLKLWREFKDKDALNLLVMSNQGLVNLLSHRYKRYDMTFEEIQSVGNLGLIKAINKFNYKEKAIEGFSTYISVVIENEILFEFRRNKKHKSVISFNQSVYVDKNNEKIKIEDIIGTDESELDDKIFAKVQHDEIYDVLEKLQPRERQTLILRYGLEDGIYRTLEEVGKIFGVTRERVRQYEKSAFVKIRKTEKGKNLRKFIE